MASVWIRARATKRGDRRYIVEFRLGGREASIRYGGSFKTRRDATTRRSWIVGEMAALRVPDLRLLADPVRSPTLNEAAERWKASRVDVAESTRVLHRVALGRVLPILGIRHVDELQPADVAELVARLTPRATSARRSPRSVTALAQTLDHAGVDPNPARDKVARSPATRGTRRATAADRRACRGRLPHDPEGSSARAALARLVGRPCRLGRRRHGRRLRRVASARSATRLGQQDPTRPLGRTAGRARRGNRGAHSALARIATRPRGCSPSRARTRCVPRSRRRAGRSRFRSGRRTTCVTAASRCCIGRAAPGPRSALSSGSVPRV